jgi:N-acetylmuramoyl-L-alanine amidase
MKIGVDPGHNCPPSDTGADGFKNECKMNKAVGDDLIALLVKAGVDVIDCCPARAKSEKDSLQRRVNTANAGRADFYVSLHHNSGGGQGCEVFAISEPGRKVAKSVLNEIVSLGFKNRGVKHYPYAVLRDTFMPAILVETCFVDKQFDCELWDSLGSKVIAEAIFIGLKKALSF